MLGGLITFIRNLLGKPAEHDPYSAAYGDWPALPPSVRLLPSDATDRGASVNLCQDGAPVFSAPFHDTPNSPEAQDYHAA